MDACRDHLNLVGSLYGDWDRGACDRWLKTFDLDPGASYGDLSKGQRMLENLAVVLARRPRLLLLDEPFSGLDPVARRLVTEGIIESLCSDAPGEESRSVVLVSHSVTDVARCADRVALLGTDEFRKWPPSMSCARAVHRGTLRTRSTRRPWRAGRHEIHGHLGGGDSLSAAVLWAAPHGDERRVEALPWAHGLRGFGAGPRPAPCSASRPPWAGRAS